MKIDFKTLAIRALNQWKVAYLPSYLGLRLFIDQLPSSTFSGYLQEYVLHKFPLREEYRYRKYSLFKEYEDKPEYRHMQAVSPSTALAEAYTLSILETMPSFKNNPNVFSYIWPRSVKSGRSYSYFFSGYKRRNNLVTQKLMKNQDYFLVVNDIKNFYPSIKIDPLLERVNKRFKSTQNNSSCEFAFTNCNQLLKKADNGIPIGPALAHVFGNIALEDIDRTMSSSLGDNYMRYVDDIYFIAEKNDIDKTEKMLSTLLSQEGLELKERKKDCLSASDWLGNMMSIQELTCHKEFDKLFNRIELYLWKKPKALSSLQKLCSSHGLPIPVEKIAIKASNGRFQKYMRNIIFHTHDMDDLLPMVKTENESSLIRDALNLNKYFFKTITTIPLPEVDPIV